VKSFYDELAAVLKELEKMETQFSGSHHLDLLSETLCVQQRQSMVLPMHTL
jgi:hypothetical protein